MRVTHECELTIPVLSILEESLLGELTTSEVREEVRARILLEAEDLKPLKNRNDQAIDQIVRNIKSHKQVPGNPVFEGLIEDVPRGFRITEKGRVYLKSAC